MAKEHEHPGQDEPRPYGQTHHEKRNTDLNSGSFEELAELPMIGRDRAQDIINHRPFNDWSDLDRIRGFSRGMIDDLKSGGARIG